MLKQQILTIGLISSTLAQFAFLASISYSLSAAAQTSPVTPDQLVKSLSSPLPIEIRPFSTGAKDPHQPLAQIQSPTQAACLRAQLAEIQKVADAAGGPSALSAEMNKHHLKFELLSNDTTSGKPSKLEPGLSREFAPASVILLIRTLVVTDSATHKVKCENISSDRLIAWLKEDVNHAVSFPAVGASGRRQSVK